MIKVQIPAISTSPNQENKTIIIQARCTVCEKMRAGAVQSVRVSVKNLKSDTKPGKFKIEIYLIICSIYSVISWYESTVYSCMYVCMYFSQFSLGK